MPFGEDTLVFRVAEKLFLLTSISRGSQFNVKCDPERAIDLRERYPEVQPGYHMNKKHWNTVLLNGSLPPGLIHKMVDLSFALVS